MRDALEFAVIALGLTACAVGAGPADGLLSESDAGDGIDAAPAGGGTVWPVDDATPPHDSGETDAGARAGDTGPPKESGTPESGACPASGFSGALFTFDLSNEPGNEASVSATGAVAGVTVGPLSRGGALTPLAGSASINSSHWPMAIEPKRFYSFTVTPAPGCSLALTTLALDVHASGSGPAAGDVATSMDNFASHRGAFAGTSKPSVSLAGVAGSHAIEVRVYAYGASSAGGTFRVQNSVTLSGSIN